MGRPVREWATHTCVAVYTNESTCTMHIVICLEWAGPIEEILFINMFLVREQNKSKVVFSTPNC
jgi:hypothetical protein